MVEVTGLLPVLTARWEGSAVLHNVGDDSLAVIVETGITSLSNLRGKSKCREKLYLVDLIFPTEPCSGLLPMGGRLGVLGLSPPLLSALLRLM